MNPSAARTVTDDVARRLRQLIHTGDLGPGDRLPAERELAEQLGVARVSLREAIKVLQGGGYVEVKRGAQGGSFVTGLEAPYRHWQSRLREEASELQDIIDYRVAIESRAARLAAERREESDLAEQRIAIERMVSAEGRSSFRLADSQFHGAVARAAASRRLEEAIHYARGELFSPIDRLVYPDQLDANLSAHRLIFQAISDRDPAAAAAAMEAHVEQTRAELTWLLWGR